MYDDVRQGFVCMYKGVRMVVQGWVPRIGSDMQGTTSISYTNQMCRDPETSCLPGTVDVGRRTHSKSFESTAHAGGVVMCCLELPKGFGFGFGVARSAWLFDFPTAGLTVSGNRKKIKSHNSLCTDVRCRKSMTSIKRPVAMRPAAVRAHVGTNECKIREVGARCIAALVSQE